MKLQIQGKDLIREVALNDDHYTLLIDVINDSVFKRLKGEGCNRDVMFYTIDRISYQFDAWLIEYVDGEVVSISNVIRFGKVGFKVNTDELILN